MKTIFQKATSLFFPPIVIISLFALTITQSCNKDDDETDSDNLKNFTEVKLVGNNSSANPGRVDPLLVNGWGVAFSTLGTLWISAEETGVTTVYDKDGNQVLPAISIPSPTASTGGHPTGQIFYSGTGFKLSNGNPAKFIFAGADGVISAWNSGTAAEKKVDDSPDAAYLGLAIASDGGTEYLYVNDFKGNKIDVYDATWNEVNKTFTDPTLPAGYSPFNIQNIDGMLYITYAKIGAGGEEETGAGKGYIDIFNPNGTFVKRFASEGALNAPWGLAKAPDTFWSEGGLNNVILVGNFGDGRINAYGSNGSFIGPLRVGNDVVEIEGLWGITFPPAGTSINGNLLYFAAGPNDEQDGLTGYIKK